MNRLSKAGRLTGAALLIAVSASIGTARADDVPSPCPAIKRIVAARHSGFAGLTPEDGHGIARPSGSEPRCEVASGTYRCEWTPGSDGGTASDVLEGVAADIAACLPEATHDVNSPARQHFYLGERGNRTQITATVAHGGRLRLVFSGR